MTKPKPLIFLHSISQAKMEADSLGAHYRTDFPSAPAARIRSRLTLDEAFAAAAFAPPVRIRRA